MFMLVSWFGLTLPLLNAAAVQQECRDRKSGSAGMPRPISYAVFCLNPATPSIYTLSLHDALPISTLPTAYDVYPLDGRHDGGYYTVKDCVTIDVLPRTPGNNVYVGFMVWSNFTATKCRGGSAGMPRSEERFSRNAETDLVCRLLLESGDPLDLHSFPTRRSSDLYPPDCL